MVAILSLLLLVTNRLMNKSSIIRYITKGEGKAMTIKQLRERKGMTQAQFAKWVGVSTQSVVYWETGRNEPPECLPNLIEHRINNENLWEEGSLYNPKSFAELRKRTGLTLNDFATYIDVPRSTIEKWEYKTRGVKPRKYLYDLIKFKIFCDYIYNK